MRNEWQLFSVCTFRLGFDTGFFYFVIYAHLSSRLAKKPNIKREKMQEIKLKIVIKSAYKTTNDVDAEN